MLCTAQCVLFTVYYILCTIYYRPKIEGRSEPLCPLWQTKSPKSRDASSEMAIFAFREGKNEERFERNGHFLDLQGGQKRGAPRAKWPFDCVPFIVSLVSMQNGTTRR